MILTAFTRLPKGPLLLHALCIFIFPTVYSQPIKLNQIQVIGTHNSYHVQAHPDLLALIAESNPEGAESLAYSHRSLTEQLDRLGVRQFELDLYADPMGGHFAKPKGPLLVGLEHTERLLHGEAMSKPGTKILHVPDIDFQTTTPTLLSALTELNNWSLKHPEHVPILILFELKEDSVGPEATQPFPWDDARLSDLEKEILNTLPEDRLVTPRLVRGGHATLRQAVLNQGWPNLDEVRGRFLLALDNTDALRDRYLALSRNHNDPILFASVSEDHPLAGWFKINDAKGERTRIQSLVEKGFMIRTRADSGTRESREFDADTREAAFAGGAQFISTDYPEPNLSFSPYMVRFPDGFIARNNPVNGFPGLRNTDLEATLIPPGGHHSDAGLRLWNQKAFDTHYLRRLNEASVMYGRILGVKPSASLTPDETERVLAMAPTLFTHPNDPFPLKSAAVVLHPHAPWIAYHLFWEDDIDFPDDNDPADHEVIWIRYNRSTLKPVEQVTYFHGKLVRESLVLTVDQRPSAAVEWGKHGSLPMSTGMPWPDGLKSNWQKLNETGIRNPGHGLAKAWPKKFTGDFEEYTRFESLLNLEAVL